MKRSLYRGSVAFLVIALTAIAVVLAASAIYFDWPPMISQWLKGYVPGFKGTLPWLGYAVAMLSFVIWIALIQPAHQHARRALINWAGCVTFLWIVAQALLIAPANHINGYRGVFTTLLAQWPANQCINSMELSTAQASMLRYYTGLVTLPVDDVAELTCPFVLMQRYRFEPDALPAPDFKLIASGNRPGDNAESFELYARSGAQSATPARPVTEKAKTP